MKTCQHYFDEIDCEPFIVQVGDVYYLSISQIFSDLEDVEMRLLSRNREIFTDFSDGSIFGQQCATSTISVAAYESTVRDGLVPLSSCNGGSHSDSPPDLHGFRCTTASLLKRCKLELITRKSIHIIPHMTFDFQFCFIIVLTSARFPLVNSRHLIGLLSSLP